MDKCGICKKVKLFETSITEVNLKLGKFVDADYLVHVKTSHGIEPDMFVGIMNSIIAGYDPTVKTNLYDTKNKKTVSTERRDWAKNI